MCLKIKAKFYVKTNNFFSSIKLFNSFDDKKKKITTDSENKANENTQQSKENHQKLAIDEDF